MFRGPIPISMDSKGRMALPTRYREFVKSICDNKMVVTIDTKQKCLLLYPVTEWESIQQEIDALPSLYDSARRIQRLLIGHATDIEVDGNGRMLLPAKLRAFAGLGKKLVLVGQGKKFEIWDEEHWEEMVEVWWKEEAEGNDPLPESLQLLSL